MFELVIVVDRDIDRPVVLTGPGDHGGGIAGGAASVTPRERPGRKHLYPVRGVPACRGGRATAWEDFKTWLFMEGAYERPQKTYPEDVPGMFWLDTLAQSEQEGCL